MKGKQTQAKRKSISKLLLLSPKENTDNILQSQKYTLNDRTPKVGKHSTIHFATHSPLTPINDNHQQNKVSKKEENHQQNEVAIKEQIIRSPSNLSDRAYRELRILEQLKYLKEKKEYYPFQTNFVDFLDWFKAKDDSQVMYCVLGRADLTLSDVKQLSLYEYKCIFFQILFALYVAQKEFEFVHNDLHLKNILLVNSASSDYCLFKDEEISWYITGRIVKITDFGLSRIRLDKNRIIYNKKLPYTEGFYPNTDVEKIFREISAKVKIIPSSWVLPIEIEQEIENYSGDDDIDEKNVAEKLIKRKKQELADLKKLARKEATLKKLIRHSFFSELQKRKSGFETPAKYRTQKSESDDEESGSDEKSGSDENSSDSEGSVEESGDTDDESTGDSDL